MQLINGDCQKTLQRIHDGSVDMVLCDLPYGTTDCKWDSPIDTTWLLSEYHRIVKKNGAIVLFASQPLTSVLVYENISDFKYKLIWKKNAGSNFGTVKYQPIKEHEEVLVFSNGGGKVTYNPITEERAASGKSRVQTEVNYNTSAEVYGSGGLVGDKGKSSKRPDQRYPSSVQYFNRERGLHPTQKPLALCEYFISTHSNVGETILDNAMGSGTTGVAARKLGRDFIGIELDPEYFKIAEDRIEDQ